MGFLHGIAAAVAVAIAVVGFFYTHIALAMAVVIESFRHWAATLPLPLDLCSHACNSYPSWYAVVVASPIPRLIVLKICSLASLSPLAATVLQSVGVDSASTCFDAESYLVCCCHHGCCIYKKCPCCRFGCGRRVPARRLCCHGACFVRPLMVVPCLNSAIAITTADGSFPRSWNCLRLGLAAGLVSAAATAAAAAAASTAAAKLKQHSS